MKLLRIDSSARGNSVSRQLTQKFVETWKKENPSGEVIERDLATTFLPLITDEWTHAAHSDPLGLSPAQRETLSVSDTLIEELFEEKVDELVAVMERLVSDADAIRTGIGRSVVRNLKTMARMGVFLERAVHQRYPEFPVRSGVHSWEEYLPPLTENLERLVETYENAAAAAAGD